MDTASNEGDSAVPGQGGPLHGVRIVEMDAIGPVPFCSLVLAGMGASIIHVARQHRSASDFSGDLLRRHRPFVAADLKSNEGRALVHRLANSADILIEGLRPGVMERLGLGPDTLRASNPRLVYGRMTGWGQTGPLAPTAGHDINYIAISGVLHAIGRAGEPPTVPLNLVGDYGGGAMFLAVGVLAALLEARRTGQGQVVDAAMVDGSASLMTMFAELAGRGAWSETRGANLLDSGAPWYDVYPARDGGYLAVGALEEPFWLQLLNRLGLDPAALPPRSDRADWPTIRAALAGAFLTRTRDEWERHFAGSDACVTPVLSLSDAARHPHMVARRTFDQEAGTLHPAPSPRFERRAATAERRELTADEALASWGA